ncbi:MAG: signal peptidase I [Clostridium sp.]|nr:signal peptidase I [Clostridium sp.]
MRYLNKKVVALYAVIIAFLIGRVFIFSGSLVSKYTSLCNPLFWLFMAILSYLVARDEPSQKMRNKYDITQSIVIIVVIYCMIYFSLGLVFGYERSPYSHEVVAILKNLWTFISVIVFQEFTRYQLVKLSPKKIGYYALITALFIIAEIDFWNFSSNFSNNVEFFKYMSQTIVPLIVTNCLFTYLSIMSANLPATIYRCLLMLMTILLPIFPALNWLIKAMMEIVLVIIASLYVNYVDIKSSRIMTRRQVKKESVVSYIPFVIVLVVLVCFISGTFKYQPIAVLSNSMLPTFARGDAVIMKKIDKKDLKKLKKGTILYYSKEGRLIVHRIVSVKHTDDGKVEVTTKGDNNNANDPWVITEDDMIGTVSFMIPYIGYPSVWVNELLK